MYDLILTIPVDVRPGKFLRRFAPEGFGQDFSALVESVKYTIAGLDCLADGNGNVWDDALLSCPSCQSKTQSRRDQYREVWRSLAHTGVVVIGLFDDNRTCLARCVVNPRTQAYAPVYGPLHYLMEARLRYAGYQYGPVCSTADVVSALEEYNKRFVEQPLVERPRQKSHVSTRKITMENPAVEIARLESSWHTWRANNLDARLSRREIRSGIKYETRPLKTPITHVFNGVVWWTQTTDRYQVRTLPKHSEETLRRLDGLRQAKHLKAKWAKHCRLAGASTDNDVVVRTVVQHKPAPRFVYREAHRVSIETEFFLDSEWRWISVGIPVRAGYHPA